MSQFRDFRSAIAGNPSLQQAFREHGIADEGTALETGRRTVRTSVFVLTDGSVVKSDSRVYRDVLVRDRQIREMAA